MKENVKFQKGFIQPFIFVLAAAVIIALVVIGVSRRDNYSGIENLSDSTPASTKSIANYTPAPVATQKIMPTSIMTPTLLPTPALTLLPTSFVPSPFLTSPTSTLTPMPTPVLTPSHYEVETLIVDYKDAVAIQVTLVGDKRALTLILSGPNKSTVDTEYISENDMLDGAETKWLHLQQKYVKSNPIAGIYTLIIKEAMSEEIFQKTFNIVGCKSTITAHSLSWKPYLGDGQYGYKPNNLINFTVRNDGDITCYIHWVDIYLDDKPFVAVIGNATSKESILSGEIAQVVVGYNDIIYAGNYTLTAKLTGRIDGVLTPLTTYKTTISVP